MNCARSILPHAPLRLLALIVALAFSFTVTETAVLSGPGRAQTRKSADRYRATAAGRSITLTGTLQITIYDDFENGIAYTEYTVLDTDNNEYILDFANIPFEAGDEILLEGVISGDTITPSRLSLISQSTRNIPTLGEQRVAVILVNSVANPIEEITPQEAYRRIFDSRNPESLNSYIREVSYGKAYLTGDAYGWYTLNIPEQELCDTDANVIEAADTDINYTNYNRVIIVWPITQNFSCSWGGVSMGIKNYNTQEGNINLSVIKLSGVYGLDHGAAAHEFGHDLGLRHANDIECGNFSLGKSCQYVQYGDQFDVMGDANIKGHYSAANKEKLKWLDSTNIAIANAGTYKITPLEIEQKSVKSVRVPINQTISYYIEFRKPVGYDIRNYDYAKTIYGAQHDVYNGIMIRRNEEILNGNTQLLDLTPKSYYGPGSIVEQKYDSVDVVLRKGQTFTDTKNGIEITTLDVTNDYVEISVNRI